MKLITTILFSLLLTPTISQFSFEIETGYLDERMAINDSGLFTKFSYPKPCFYSNVRFYYKLKFIKFIQDIDNTYSIAENSYSFRPIDINYCSTLEFKISKWLILGAKHYCLHPIINVNLPDNYKRVSGNRVFCRIVIK